MTVWPAATPAQVNDAPALHILVPVPAGGTSDYVARLIADRLSNELTRPVIVENKPGATGRIAVDALRNAKPDGATLLLAPITVPVVAPLVFKNLSYDWSRDLVPVAQLATYEFALAVMSDHPARSVREFVAWAKEHRSKATFGAIAIGSLPQLLGMMLAKTGGIELDHVPYNGIAPLETDLMRGQLAAGIGVVSDFIALHRAGKIRILATSGAKRSTVLPDVRTFGEQGYPSL
ncbi:MAG TPA: tripartite tricarboxylate transporter substrate-binding protein, partial [Casimicrobiaceae bacterium]|nr:tripartite tricarboxylate transporter substrate-binding protein [Casimicrobiaceae bacterium]